MWGNDSACQGCVIHKSENIPDATAVWHTWSVYMPGVCHGNTARLCFIDPEAV